jgi:hypothetical protein
MQAQLFGFANFSGFVFQRVILNNVFLRRYRRGSGEFCRSASLPYFGGDGAVSQTGLTPACFSILVPARQRFIACTTLFFPLPKPLQINETPCILVALCGTKCKL